jgi:methylmalonyl-CoA carboxyltransferase large subunit
MAKKTMKDLAELLERIQSQLAELALRVEQLEGGSARQPAPEPLPRMQEAPPPESAPPDIAEEELLAISAAIAAYLGVRIHIRQIRLLSSRSWAQQGRVSVQASHNVHN